MRSEPEITNYALRGLLSVEYLITTPEKRESFEDEADAGWTYLADVDGYTLYTTITTFPWALPTTTM